MATTRSAGGAATSVDTGPAAGNSGIRKLSTASVGGIAGGVARDKVVEQLFVGNGVTPI